jgi:hypothetical protein
MSFIDNYYLDLLEMERSRDRWRKIAEAFAYNLSGLHKRPDMTKFEEILNNYIRWVDSGEYDKYRKKMEDVTQEHGETVEA